jgi:hypothetical protein
MLSYNIIRNSATAQLQCAITTPVVKMILNDKFQRNLSWPIMKHFRIRLEGLRKTTKTLKNRPPGPEPKPGPPNTKHEGCYCSF